MSRGSMLLRAGFAAFIAVMLAGPGAAVFPSTLRWASPIACPRGTAPAPRTFHASYHRPGERGVAFYCVAPDGAEHERTLAAMGGLWLMYFMGLSVLFSLLALRGGAREASPHATSGTVLTPRHVPAGVEAKARELLARDQKLHTIKIVREATGMGLKEAKDWVEALPQRPAGRAGAVPSTVVDPRLALDIVPPDVEANARALVASGQTISAIKVVRDATGLGLKEAKDWVEALPLRPPRTATSAPSTSGAPAAQPGAADRLAELKRMLDTGLITAAEYEAKKSEILAEL